MISPRYLAALVCSCALAFSTAAASVDLAALAERSPFMPAEAAGLPAMVSEPVGTLEFRGVVVEPEGVFFSVFDATANRGYWLREGVLDGTMRVARYDSESAVLEVEQNGRAIKLELKQASTATSAKPVLTAAVPAGDRIRRTLRAQPTAEQAERMAQIAKEVRERRALRQAGQTPQGRPPTPVSPSL